ncbi:LOW QUALITY PROTEIN: hypothetical protein HID58_043142, partial [Brassica napus]
MAITYTHKRPKNLQPSPTISKEIQNIKGVSSLNVWGICDYDMLSHILCRNGDMPIIPKYWQPKTKNP